jgi:stage II sporulation protein D
VALTTAGAGATISATGPFTWQADADGPVLARANRGEEWRIERDNNAARVRALSPASYPGDWQRALLVRSDQGFVTVNGKRYRGDLVVVPSDSSYVVVNRLDVEDYLRGVVPLEIGNRPRGDSAALQAQAVASRSYAYVRTAEVSGSGTYDVTATTTDQVYGGRDAENPLANAAIDATRGLVLRYQGRVVDAPFHSTCGGTTAEAPEVWRANGAPYLQRVSDRIGRSDRYYCDIAPRFRWTRTLSGAELNAALAQYLRIYAAAAGTAPGRARSLNVRSRTPSGRVGVLDIETDRATFSVRGNDIRYVLRPAGGDILSSTYFSVEPSQDRDGFVERVTLRGQGNGHGVGMCQWGTIGRARAGQSFRTILGTYYPGTSVGPATVQ